MSGLLLGLASGAILVPLNSTMLAVALPALMREYEVDAATITTLVTLYLGTVVVALPASGALADRFGHRRIFLVGIAAFAASSLLAVLAVDFALLAGARVLQAVSGALVSTSATSLVRAIAPSGRRGATFGLFDMLVSTSAAVGPFVGGVLVGAFGWRSLFLLALPIAVVAGLSVGWPARGGRWAQAAAASAVRRTVDLPGLFMLAAVLTLLLLTLRGAGTSIGLAPLVALPILIAGLVAWELRASSPALDLRLLVRPAFGSALLGVLGVTVILHAMFILIPLAVDGLLGGAATTSGMVLLGISGIAALVAPFGGHLSDRLGRRVPAVAGALLVLGALGALSILAPIVTVPLTALLLGIVGLGFGLSGSPRLAAALEGVPANAAGMAAGTYLTGRYLGGALGAMLAGSVLASGVTAASVGLGFGLLAVIALAVALVSLALPGRSRIAAE